MIKACSLQWNDAINMKHHWVWSSNNFAAPWHKFFKRLKKRKKKNQHQASASMWLIRIKSLFLPFFAQGAVLIIDHRFVSAWRSTYQMLCDNETDETTYWSHTWWHDTHVNVPSGGSSSPWFCFMVCDHFKRKDVRGPSTAVTVTHLSWRNITTGRWSHLTRRSVCVRACSLKLLPSFSSCLQIRKKVLANGCVVNFL